MRGEGKNGGREGEQRRPPNFLGGMGCCCQKGKLMKKDREREKETDKIVISFIVEALD